MGWSGALPLLLIGAVLLAPLIGALGYRASAGSLSWQSDGTPARRRGRRGCVR